jgi:hypothetical protein
LASYKISTQQIHTPFSELSALPIDSQDPVSQAIQRFKESKILEDRADYYRQRRLATICRREARRTRHAKSTNPPPKSMSSTTSQRRGLIRCPSTIIELPSDKEEAGLPSPPDSQSSKPQIKEPPSTPAPKLKIRRATKTKTYDESNGQLGLSSPPQQRYDPQENQEEWYMDEVEVGDVPSSVLRGVEGLWALAS